MTIEYFFLLPDILPSEVILMLFHLDALLLKIMQYICTVCIAFLSHRIISSE